MMAGPRKRLGTAMIRKIAIIVLEMLFLVGIAFSQNTSLTATIQDSAGQTWANGTFSVTFFPVPNFPNNYQWQGSKFVPKTYSGTMNGSGTMTVTLPDNNTITPAGTQWSFVLCPNATASCTTVTTPVTGSSEDLSSLFSSRVVPPIIYAAPMPRAYSSSEVTNPPGNQGGQFYQVVDNVPYFWTGSQWIALGGTVSSVGLSMPSIFSCTGSPITGSGTITCTLVSETANTVFAAPNGSSGTPVFRALVAADIPSLPYIPTGGQAGSVANFLTPGTGLSGSAFNGSAAETWTINGTGTGTKVATATAAGTSGNCAQWTSAGDVGDAGNPCLTSSSFSSGNNANGYWVKDPTGRIEQWQQATAISDDTAITFPTAYTTASSISITISPVWPSGDTGYCSIVSSSITTTGFTVHPNNQSSIDCNWIATGY